MTVLLFAAVLVFYAAGCRQSPAFMRYYEETSVPETASVSVPQDSEEPDLDPETEEDQPDDSKNEQSTDLIEPDEMEKEASEEKQADLDSESEQKNDETAESNKTSLDGDTGNSGQTKSDEEDGTTTDGESPETGTDQTDGTSENGDGDEGEGSPADSDGDGKTGNPQGIIAQGQAAVLVQLLGGENILAGIDGSTLEAMKTYFPASELSTAIALGGGSSLDASLVSAMEEQPALCFMDSSDASISALGIECVVLDFSSIDGIMNSVERVRSMLNSSYADNMAQAYNNTFSNICSRVAGSGAARTVYISQWDSGAGLYIGTEGEWFVEINGLAVADRCAGTPLNRLLQIANVDNSVLSAGGSRNWYVNSLLTDGYTVNWWDSTRFDIQLGDGSAVTLVNGLGGIGYPAVIAANSNVKAQIENAAASGNNIWTVCSPDGLITEGGTIASVISGSFSIYVNPQGLGSWTNGSPESILEPLWVGWRIQGICSEAEVRQSIRDFYQTFYRCSLTEAQLNQILAGY